MYSGVALGGPLDGERLVSRRPKGLLVVDRPARRAYVYDYLPTTPRMTTRPGFVIREGYEDGQELDYDRRVATAESEDFDVIAWTADG